MELHTLLLAEDARYHEGCFSILRGGWDRVAVTAEDPRLRSCLVLRFGFSDVDAGTARIVLQCREQTSDQAVFEVEREITGTRPEGYPPEWAFPVDMVVRLDGPLPGPGQYEIEVLVNGSSVGTTHFRAVASSTSELMDSEVGTSKDSR